MTAIRRSRSPRRTHRPLLHPLALALACALGGTAGAQTLPSGLGVASGQASVASDGSRMTIGASDRAVLNWQSFSIGAGQSVRFELPSASSQVLNRVLGRDASQISGSLSSNGQVWLLNPHGVIFGAGSRLDVAGLVASTLNLSDADWLARRHTLTGGRDAGVVSNAGEIRTTRGGQVLLLGGKAGVSNQGLIEAPEGQVVLAAGASIDIADSRSPQLAVRVSAPAGEAVNLGQLIAPGGRIDIAAAMVNQQGIVRADSLSQGPAGEIRLTAADTVSLAAGSQTRADGPAAGRIDVQGGTTLVAGTLSADGEAGRGGSVRLLGEQVALLDGAQVSASGRAGGGEVLVGGPLQGADPSVPRARAVYMGSAASVRADALEQGSGGLVVLWSRQATRAYGSLSARGGPLGGNGGLIETSGGWLDARPSVVRTDAPRGAAGRWLLDPNDIAITDSAPDQHVSSGPDFRSTDDAAVINGATLAAALNSGSNVTVTTDSRGANSQAGNIRFDAALNVAPSAPVDLTLIAARHIDLDGAVISNAGGPLNLRLEAGLSGQGGIRLIGSSIAVGGDVRLGGPTLACGAAGCAPFAAAVGTVEPGRGFGVHLESSSIVAERIVVRGASAADAEVHGGVKIDGSSLLRARVVDVAGWTGSPAANEQYGIWHVGTIEAVDRAVLDGTSRVSGPGSVEGTAVGVMLEASSTMRVGPTATSVAGIGGGIHRLGRAERAAAANNPDPPIGAADAGRALSITGSSDPRPGMLDDSVVAGSDMQVTDKAGISIQGQGGRVLLAGFTLDWSGAGSARVTGEGRLLVSSSSLQLPTAEPVLLANTGGVEFHGTVSGSPSSLTIDSPKATVRFGAGSVVSVAPTAVSIGAAGLDFTNATLAASRVTILADDVSLAAAASINASAPGDAITIAGQSGNARSFLVGAGAVPLNTPNGRWLVYATDPSGPNFNAGALPHDFKQYGARYGVNNPLGAGNGLLFAAAPRMQLSGNVTGSASKVYDGTTSSDATLSAPTLSGLLPGDTLIGEPLFGPVRYASPDVGQKIALLASRAGPLPDVVDQAGKPVYGYGLDPTIGGATGSISPRTVSLTSVAALDKVYDGNRDATVRLSELTGVVAGEDLTVRPRLLQFDSADAGRDRPVTGTVELADGLRGKAANYVLSGDGKINTSASILPKPIGLVGVTALDKVYDGTASATITGGSLSGLVAGETLVMTFGAASFDTQHAGVGKPVTGTLTLADGAGGRVANYSLAGGGRFQTTASILPRTITVTGLGVLDKTYDGSTRVVASGEPAMTGQLGDERPSLLIGALNFDAADVGNGRPVTGTLALGDGSGGALARNYTLEGGGAFVGTGSILPRPLRLADVIVGSRPYDGTRRATLSGATLAGLVGAQTLTVLAEGLSFDTADAGVGKPVSGVARLADGSNGGRASNYVLDGDARIAAFGTVTPRTLGLLGVRADSRLYDGTTAATVGSDGLQGLVAGESLRVDLAGRFATADAGVAKDVAVTAVLADGANGRAANYRVEPGSAKADIRPRPVTAVGVVALDKTYDGTTAASFRAAEFQGIVAGETLALAADAAFDSRNAGNARAVSGSISLADGSGRASNYLLTNAGRVTGTAAILPRGVGVSSARAADKVYDGTTAAVVAGFVIDGALPGDQVAVSSGSGRFQDADTGRDKNVLATATALGGADAGNYTLARPSVATRASITPATLSYVADPTEWARDYPPPPLAGSVTGFVAGESLAGATTGQLSFTTTATQTSPYGTYAVLGTGLTARNYVFTQAGSNATALTVVPLSTTQLGEHRSTVPPVNELIALVQPPPLITSVTAHRTLDAMPALQSAPPIQVFRALDLGGSDQQQLAAVLAARDRYKKALFADAISQLERNPGVADAPACQTVEQAADGQCLITEALKLPLRERLQAQQLLPEPPAAPPLPGRPAEPARAQLPPVAAPAAVPAAAAATPSASPAATAVVPAATAAAAVAREPLPRLPAAREVRKASLPQIGRKWALLIGTDIYADSRIPRLDNAVADVEAVAKVLEGSLGYQTMVVRNGSKATILGAFNQLAAAVMPNDSVAVYYAGHGELVDKVGLGYWQPSDADATRPESWISNTDIGKLIGQFGASQVALVSDSCFSGSLVSEERIRGSGSLPDPTQLLSRRAAVVMSSGGNEPVFDSGKNGHSTFAWSFMRTLERVAGWRPGGNVFEQVRFDVARQVPQRPQYGASRLGGHQSGADYLFEQRQLDALPK